MNTGELDLPGLRVTDGEPEMRRELVPALSKPEACPLFRTRSSTLARGTALDRPPGYEVSCDAESNLLWCGRRSRCRSWLWGRSWRFGSRGRRLDRLSVHDAVIRRAVECEFAAVPHALDHAERNRGDQQYENQAHVLVPPLWAQISRMRGKQKGAWTVNRSSSQGTVRWGAGFWIVTNV